MAAVTSEELRTVLWMFVLLLTADFKFRNRSTCSKGPMKRTGKVCGIPKTWNHLCRFPPYSVSNKKGSRIATGCPNKNLSNWSKIKTKALCLMFKVCFALNKVWVIFETSRIEWSPSLLKYFTCDFNIISTWLLTMTNKRCQLKREWTYGQHQFLIVHYWVKMLSFYLRIWMQVDKPF